MKKSKFRESFECKEIRFRAERVETRMALERVSPYIRETLKYVGKEVTSKEK